ncbi:oligosaccharide flippase family protein [Litorilituus lipolyticus]|uniref:Uncharacterized protein n=1 Tax=Litorilituus lipolyticus TaxID=2491017 RepID=A0A502L069_9GAMM|nr:oligosaccharide flippase family protein [Litorilituus lipolyticus]TPH17076.1 hypothetical protein EPA86_05175 [Litorilituus lipolyticus]
MKKNFIFSAASNALKLFSGIILFFIYARVFNPSEFGELTYAIVIATVIGLFVDFGYTLYLPKEATKKNNDITKLVSNALIVKVILSLLSFSALFIGHELEIIVGDLALLLPFCFSTILVSFGNTFLLPYRSLNRFHIETKYLMVQHISLSVMAILVMIVQAEVMLIAYIYMLARLLFFICAFLNFRKEFNFRWSYQRGITKEIQRVAPYAVHAVIATLMIQIDTLILANYVESDQIGVYQAGMRLVMASSLAISIFYDVLIPKFSSTINGEPNKFIQLVQRYNQIVIFIGALCSVILYFFSELIILLLYGNSMIELNSYIALFSIFIFLRFFGVTYNTLLTCSGNQKKRALYLAITLLFIVLLESWLIPLYKINGALISLILGHCLLYTLTMNLTKKEFGTFFLLKRSKI